MTDSDAKMWKTALLRGFGFGAGFALVCLVAIGAWVWNSNRPKLPVPWNSRALTATYEFVTSEGEPQHLVFAYTLQNNTNQDYRLDGHEDLELVNKLSTEKSIYRQTEKSPHIRFPVFVPAHGRTTFLFDEPSEYTGKKDDEGDAERHRADVQEFVKENYRNVNGFILFDHTHRYQIDLPKGW
jgi:hypothetical protein